MTIPWIWRKLCSSNPIRMTCQCSLELCFLRRPYLSYNKSSKIQYLLWWIYHQMQTRVWIHHLRIEQSWLRMYALGKQSRHRYFNISLIFLKVLVHGRSPKSDCSIDRRRCKNLARRRKINSSYRSLITLKLIMNNQIAFNIVWGYFLNWNISSRVCFREKLNEISFNWMK